MHLFNSIQTNGRTPRYYSPGKLVFAFVLTCLLFKQLDGSIIHSKISTQLKNDELVGISSIISMRTNGRTNE
jgi:hypothetical protein